MNNVVSPVSKSLVDELVTPIIKKLKSEYKKKYNDYLVPRSEHFKRYLDEAYNEYSSLNTLVFHDRIKSLKDVYLPLVLIKEDKTESVIINGISTYLVKRYKKLLIIDTAGMGKSTMLKRMFLDVNDIGLKEVGIPLFVDLRRLKKDWTIIDEIERRLSSLSETFDKELLLYFLEEGGFIFFLDGYDEIPLNDKDSVTQSLQDFIKKANRNYFILTSRPENAIWGFEGFVIYNIRPLKKEEAYTLLKKYDRHKNKEISAKLINLLESDDFKSAAEFLETPLLTTLLFNAFDYKETIPLKKHLFYRQIYDAYFESHDLKKGDSYIHDKYSGLDIDDFGRVLKYIGFHSLNNGIEYSKDEILSIIDRAKDFYSKLSFKSSDFLKDILTPVPLFSQDGTKYKWAHKSLMEYFAARFISEDTKENQDKVLSAIINSYYLVRYDNLLDLYYDMDYKGFSKNITLPICKEFTEFFDNHWVDLDIIHSLIEERIGLLFYLYPDDIDKSVYPADYGASYSIYFSVCDADSLKEYKGEYNMGVIVNFEYVQISEDEYIYFKETYPPAHRLSILDLMYRNKPDLFMKIHKANTDSDFVKGDFVVADYIKKHTFSEISVRTCNKIEKAYLLLNSLLSLPSCHYNNLVSLDYNACKKEIELIEENITESNNLSKLLDGFF